MTIFFFFNDTATTEIYTLSLHDALPIYGHVAQPLPGVGAVDAGGIKEVLVDVLEPGEDDDEDEADALPDRGAEDRKSTRLNSSHANISYAVFCLKKKNSTPNHIHLDVPQ